MTYLKMNQPEKAKKHLQAALDAGGSHMFPLREQTETALNSLNTQ
jgi:hypothetical protein